MRQVTVIERELVAAREAVAKLEAELAKTVRLAAMPLIEHDLTEEEVSHLLQGGSLTAECVAYILDTERDGFIRIASENVMFFDAIAFTGVAPQAWRSRHSRIEAPRLLVLEPSDTIPEGPISVEMGPENSLTVRRRP